MNFKIFQKIRFKAAGGKRHPPHTRTLTPPHFIQSKLYSMLRTSSSMRCHRPVGPRSRPCGCLTRDAQRCATVHTRLIWMCNLLRRDFCRCDVCYFSRTKAISTTFALEALRPEYGKAICVRGFTQTSRNIMPNVALAFWKPLAAKHLKLASSLCPDENQVWENCLQKQQKSHWRAKPESSIHLLLGRIGRDMLGCFSRLQVSQLLSLHD